MDNIDKKAQESYPKGSIQQFLLKKLEELEHKLNKLEKEYYGTLHSKR